MPDVGAITGAAKNFACELYKNVPGAIIPNPISDVLRHAWDGFCGGDNPYSGGLPASPAPQFSGGQCECVAYDVFATLFEGSPFQDGYIQTAVSVRLLGKVTGTWVKATNADSYELGYVCRGDTTAPCKPYPQLLKTNNAVRSRDGLRPYLRINSVVRVGGAADNCGNPPPDFPPAPLSPPGGYTSPPTPITFNDNSIKNYYFNFTPPVAPALPANFIPPIVINYFNAALNPDFNIPITFNFDGSINFGGGGGGEFNQDDRDEINNINNTTNNIQNDITNIQNEINNITNNYNNKPPNPDDFDPPPAPTAPGEHQKSFLAAVEVTLTQIPKNAKTQSGDGAPDILYAGWFEWRRAGKFTPRQPIHFEKSVFLAPQGVDGYAFTLYDGFNGTAQEIVNKEKV